jgi:hypothetical protein
MKGLRSTARGQGCDRSPNSNGAPRNAAGCMMAAAACASPSHGDAPSRATFRSRDHLAVHAPGDPPVEQLLAEQRGIDRPVVQIEDMLAETIAVCTEDGDRIHMRASACRPVRSEPERAVPDRQPAASSGSLRACNRRVRRAPQRAGEFVTRHVVNLAECQMRGDRVGLRLR